MNIKFFAAAAGFAFVLIGAAQADEMALTPSISSLMKVLPSIPAGQVYPSLVSTSGLQGFGSADFASAPMATDDACQKTLTAANAGACLDSLFVKLAASSDLLYQGSDFGNLNRALGASYSIDHQIDLIEGEFFGDKQTADLKEEIGILQSSNEALGGKAKIMLTELSKSMTASLSCKQPDGSYLLDNCPDPKE